jgi:tRNA(adenine34) deaminase
MKNFRQFRETKKHNADEERMYVAIQLAIHAKSNGDHPAGAVLAWVGDKNISEHDTRFSDRNPLNYAIINVINKASDTLGYKKLSEAVLYTTIEPNLLCALAIQEAGIKEVVFGAFDDLEGYLSSKPLAESVVLDISAIGGVMGEECCKILPESMTEHVRYE